MRKHCLTLTAILLFSSTSNSAISKTAPDWNQLLTEAQTALNNDDSSYAFYKLRKAWLSVPNKDLSSDPYKKIRATLAEVVLASPIKKEAKVIKGNKYSMQKLDKRFRLRDSYATGDNYRVELKPDGNLLFTINGLDNTSAEPVCGNIKMSKDEAQKWKQATIRARQNLKAKMPIIINPTSNHYNELLALCQPISSGETKSRAGFDFSPFAPADLKALPDF